MMQTLAGLLTAIAGSLAKKVLAALGMGFITYVGLDTAVSAAISSASSSMGGMASDVSAILAISGFFTACSVIAGGITASVAMVSLTRLGKLV